MSVCNKIWPQSSLDWNNRMGWKNVWNIYATCISLIFHFSTSCYFIPHPPHQPIIQFKKSVCQSCFCPPVFTVFASNAVTYSLNSHVLGWNYTFGNIKLLKYEPSYSGYKICNTNSTSDYWIFFVKKCELGGGWVGWYQSSFKYSMVHMPDSSIWLAIS